MFSRQEMKGEIYCISCILRIFIYHKGSINIKSIYATVYLFYIIYFIGNTCLAN